MRCGAELRGPQRGYCSKKGSGKYNGRCPVHRAIAHTEEERARNKAERIARHAAGEAEFEARACEKDFLRLAISHGLDAEVVREAYTRMIIARRNETRTKTELNNLTA